MKSGASLFGERAKDCENTVGAGKNEKRKKEMNADSFTRTELVARSVPDI